MKNYIYITFLLICNFITAQELPVLSTTSLANSEDALKHPKNGNYAQDTNNYRDQYVGLWEYNQNGIIFQLKIEKLDQALNKIEYNGEVSHYNYTDEVILRYKLIKNGTVIFNNLNELTIDHITSYGIKQAGSIFLHGRFLDHTRNVVGTYDISKQSGSPTTIIFDLNLGTYTLKNPPSYYQDGQPLFSIPTGGIIMTKIN